MKRRCGAASADDNETFVSYVAPATLYYRGEIKEPHVTKFVRKLRDASDARREASSSQPIVVYLSSHGGCVYGGITMYEHVRMVAAGDARAHGRRRLLRVGSDAALPGRHAAHGVRERHDAGARGSSSMWGGGSRGAARGVGEPGHADGAAHRHLRATLVGEAQGAAQAAREGQAADARGLPRARLRQRPIGRYAPTKPVRGSGR